MDDLPDDLTALLNAALTRLERASGISLSPIPPGHGAASRSGLEHCLRTEFVPAASSGAPHVFFCGAFVPQLLSWRMIANTPSSVGR